MVPFSSRRRLIVARVFSRSKGSAVSTFAPMASQILAISSFGASSPMAFTGKARMGLKSGHGRAAVVQDDQGDVCLVVNGIDQGRQDRVEKGRIPANGQGRLIHSEHPELAEPAGQADAGTHGMDGLDRAEARRAAPPGYSTRCPRRQIPSGCPAAGLCGWTRKTRGEDSPGRR